MKIAILQTDHIPEHRRGVAGGNYPEMFANLFLNCLWLLILIFMM